MIPVLVISLVSAIDRRAHMTESLTALGIPFEFFDATNGRAMSPGELAVYKPQRYFAQIGRQLTNTEIAVAASFKRVLTKIAKGPDAIVAVLEDDAILTEDTKQFLMAKNLSAVPQFDALRLYNDIYTGIGGFYMEAGQIGKYAIAAPIKPGIGCVAQVFSKEGAKKIAEHIVPLYAPIDNLIYRDSFIPGLKILEVRPAVASFKVMPSTVGEKLRQDPTFYLRLRKRHALLSRNIRSVVRFVRAWGFLSLFKLRYLNRRTGQQSQ